MSEMQLDAKMSENAPPPTSEEAVTAMRQDRRTIRALLRVLGVTMILFTIFGIIVRVNQVRQNELINRLSESIAKLTASNEALVAQNKAQQVTNQETRTEFAKIAEQLVQLGQLNRDLNTEQLKQIGALRQQLAQLLNQPRPTLPNITVTPPEVTIDLPEPASSQPPVVIPPPPEMQNTCIINLLGIKLLC